MKFAETRPFHKILEAGLVVAILIAVGGFGGTEPISWGVSQVLIFTLGIILALYPRQESWSGHTKLFVFPFVLAAWVTVQWIESRSGRIGFDTHAIEAQGLTLATSFVAFFIAFTIARERMARKRLAFSLIALGICEALYGLGQYLAGWQYIWNVPRRFYLGSATGSYINHNNFAGLLEMILPLSLSLALYYWQSVPRRLRRRTWRQSIAGLGQPEILKCFLLIGGSVLLLLATIFSFSRMGLISMIASLFVMAAAMSMVRIRRRHYSPLPSLMILALLAGGLAATAWVGAGPVIERFERLPQNEPLDSYSEGRAAVWRDSVWLIRAHPFTGVGLGCFQYAFTEVQSIRLAYAIDHAHNDYIELAAELGLPCALTLFAILFWLPIQFARASLGARSSLTRSLALGALGGSAALLVHSIADFNLHIPANAMVFAVILGLGYSGVAEMRSENVHGDEVSRETSAYQGSVVRLKSSSQTVPAI